MKNNLWRSNFEISRPHFVMFSQFIDEFPVYLKKTVPGFKFNDFLAVFENGVNIGCYFKVDELRHLIDESLSIIINDAVRIQKIHREAIKFNDELFRFVKKHENIRLEELKKPDIIKLFNETIKYVQPAHGHAVVTTWFVDSDGEDLSRYLMNFLKVRISDLKLSISLPEAFSLLTTPLKKSLVQNEEIEFYEVLKSIRSDIKAKKIFMQEDVNKILSDLKNINPVIRNKTARHYKKWLWMPYAYTGPAYDLEYYLSLWSSLVRQAVRPQFELKKIKSESLSTASHREQMIKLLKLSKKEKELFDLVAEIVWLKNYRKEVSFYAYFFLGKIMKELARRAGLSMNQMNQIMHFEMKYFDKIDVGELNERHKFSIMYLKDAKITITTGEKAKKYLEKQKFELVKKNNTGILTGTTAFAGTAKGVVKIVNHPEEMAKLNVGDIMVAHTTFPSLVPAMKKAGAIVTDDGGVTCHAAIVARELKKPCVVGTKTATKDLKDGDNVLVDANTGIVKKIK